MKAILVIDMPDGCCECPLNASGCGDLHKSTGWCPLMPIEAYDTIREELKKRVENPERYAKR